jgi:hypothetical protein
MRIAVCLLVCLLCPSLPIEAGQAPAAPVAVGGTGLPADAPPAPIAPATINRSASGKATLRAVRVSTPLDIDGKLDETVYREVEPISGFIQNDPKEGAPATEKSEVWVLFDDANFYVVCRCWESDPSALVANEMRRDNINIVNNDQFAWGIDTFHDRRNMLIFEVSAAGGRIDGQVTNERQVSLDWNPIWAVKTARFEGGYVVEAAIPFKSIRYAIGESQPWGIQLRRHNMVKNEYSYVTPIPASVGSQGHFRAGLAATLVGVEAPRSSKNLDIKPYATANLITDKAARPIVDNDGNGDVGLDVKYGVTQSLSADLTINTDFAQVEADEQQVNLTRFSLFFPEKRDFFLENAGIFNFGVTGAASAGGDAPLLFYSRNIGLFQGREVPIRAGGRLSGRAGLFTVGLLNVQTGDDVLSGARSTNYSVVRVRRDILRRSNIGMIATNRSVGANGLGANQAYGVDSTFSFGPDLVIASNWAQSRTDNIGGGDDMNYRAYLDYNADRYGVQVDHVTVEPRFDPQIGFVRRRDMRKNLGMFRFSPRPKNAKLVRKYTFSLQGSVIHNTAGRLETREGIGKFQMDLQSGDSLSANYSQNYEFVPVPFRIASGQPGGVTLPVGGYEFGSGQIQYNFGRQRNVSGNVSVNHGSFYDGNKTTWSISSGRFNVSPRLSVEPSYSVNQIELSAGEFRTHLLTTRTTFTVTPLMFTTALLQYNSSSNTFAMNVRFRWEYSPGSEFFVVYNDQRDTFGPATATLQNRAVVVKVNRVFRF